MKLYVFRTFSLSIIQERFAVHTAMVYVIQVYWQLVSRSKCSCSQAVKKPVWHITLLCVQWKTPDDGQRNCPKHVEFHFKNKCEKLVHLVAFIIRNLSRCTVTWTSNSPSVCKKLTLLCAINEAINHQKSFCASTVCKIQYFQLLVYILHNKDVPSNSVTEKGIRYGELNVKWKLGRNVRSNICVQ